MSRAARIYEASILPRDNEEDMMAIVCRKPFSAVCKHCRVPVPADLPSHWVVEHMGWMGVHSGEQLEGCRGVTPAMHEFALARVTLEHELYWLLEGCPQCDGVEDSPQPHKYKPLTANVHLATLFLEKRPKPPVYDG